MELVGGMGGRRCCDMSDPKVNVSLCCTYVLKCFNMPMENVFKWCSAEIYLIFLIKSDIAVIEKDCYTKCRVVISFCTFSITFYLLQPKKNSFV